MHRFTDSRRPGCGPSAACGALRCLVADGSSDVIGQLHRAIRSTAPQSVLLPPVTDLENAAARVERDRPDILFLDLGMPRMTGITILRSIQQSRPQRVVLLAPLSAEAGIATWEALTLGAHGFLVKHGAGSYARLASSAGTLAAKMRRLFLGIPPSSGAQQSRRTPVESSGVLDVQRKGIVLLLGTGWMRRIARVVAQCGMTQGMPMLLVTPHPRVYSEAFREGLDRISPVRVRFAREGDNLVPEQLFFARGGPGHVLRIHPHGMIYEREAPSGPDADARASGVLLRVAAGGFDGILETVARPRQALRWVDRSSRSSFHVMSSVSNESPALPPVLSLHR